MKGRRLGLILAGGLGRRMGGAEGTPFDKARLQIGGKSLMSRAISCLAPQVAALAINANPPLARYSDLGLPLIPDSLGGHLGPLAGLLAGLDYGAEHGFAWLLTLPADSPFPPSDLGAHLETTNAKIALAEREGRLQPLFGLWHVSLAERLRESLEAGERQIGAWAMAQGGRRVAFDGGAYDPFTNINTPEDHAKAEALARSLSL